MQNRKLIFFSIIIIISTVALLTLVGMNFYQSRQVKTDSQTPTDQLPSRPEEHFLTPVPTAAPTPKPEITPRPTMSDADLIKKAMAEKYNKPLADTDLIVQNNTDTYANGGVKFAGEIGGGWWLAAKEEEEWVIVADGNGTVMCADIEPYNFPINMVPECWDEATSQLITR